MELLVYEMNMLSRAILIAAEAHRGQVDKAGEPYILHPLRVMWRVETPLERVVAVLHDVMEDCGVTFFDLVSEHRFPVDVAIAVECLTRTEEENYQQYIERCGRFPLTRRVKLADLDDNLSRAKGILNEEHIARYRKARDYLLEIEARTP